MKVIIVEDEFPAQQELTWLITPTARWRLSDFDDGLDVLKFRSTTRLMPFFSTSTHTFVGRRSAAEYQPVRA